MPAILLVRHGQALDPLQGSYDGLSELGEKQAAQIGEALRNSGAKLARFAAGPRIRQRRTAELALRSGPAIESLDLLDEHLGTEVVAHVLAHTDSAGPEVASALSAVQVAPSRGGMARVVAEIVRGWALGKIAAPVRESFPEFRLRTGRALAELSRDLDGASSVVAFTSGGFIGAAVAHALGLDDSSAVELGLQVDNASVTELRFSRRAPGKFVLKRFNGVAHLERASVTGI